jgi:4-amino-4-deoxy-L-arabinose transferase-like glycosyltransferase
MHLASLVVLSAVALLPGLGSSSRLTYHEAFVAQGAREMLDSGEWAYPTIGGLPWLEKPPLPWWLTAAIGRCTGGVNETVARLPSVLSAVVMVLGVAVLGARHYGPGIGVLAGAIQATTAWTVLRGRLAEADMLLACLITWAIVAFDGILAVPASGIRDGSSRLAAGWRLARWAFFALLCTTTLVKGIGFGAVLILVVVAGALLWQRDGTALRRLYVPAAWALVVAIASAWPLWMILRHGRGVLALWTMHVACRMGGQADPGPFASEPWWEYVPALLGQALPWTPLALVGAWHSLGRALLHACSGDLGGRGGIPVPAAVVAGDRLLWAWAAAPLGLLALATVKNAHYVISAQVPWSIWAALAFSRVGARLQLRAREWHTVLLAMRLGFTALAIVYGLAFWLLGPWLDRRGVEWAFYESAGHRFSPQMSLVLLYDDWDRNPYPSPFGPIPHDLAVRLFYLGRAACWHVGAESVVAKEHTTGQCSQGIQRPGTDVFSHSPPESAFAVIGRVRDRPALEQMGHVEVIAHGPRLRRDRTYDLFVITPGEAVANPRRWTYGGGRGRSFEKS